MQPVQQHESDTNEIALYNYLSDFARQIMFMTWIAAIITLIIAFAASAGAQDQGVELPLPAKAPANPEVPERNPLFGDVDEWRTLPEDSEIAPQPPVPSQKAQRAGGRIKSDKPIGPPPRPTEWSDQAITDARAQCKNLLSEAIFEYEPLDPIRKGVCGTAAPIGLSAVSAGQTVTIRPAAKLNCTMASRLHRWLVEVVQPSAKAHLEREITGVINIASYNCRPRYNDPGKRISQHAYANALDLAGFITAKGEQIAVEKYWRGDTAQSRFLKEIHEGACKIFGTVLGPEANAAHKNHFHLDMAKRRHGSYCE